jgi:hypothetical protein
MSDVSTKPVIFISYAHADEPGPHGPVPKHEDLRQIPHTTVGLHPPFLLNAAVQGADAGCCGRPSPGPI